MSGQKSGQMENVERTRAAESHFFNLSVRGIIVLSLVWTVCVMSYQDREVREPMYTLVGMAVGWYFGQRRSEREEETRPRRSVMPSGAAAAAVLCAGLLVGCSTFKTIQEDVSYGKDGKPERKITTRATARTFWDGKSELARFSATQTDKSQSAKVGSLSNESASSNALALVERVIAGAVAGAVKGGK